MAVTAEVAAKQVAEGREPTLASAMANADERSKIDEARIGSAFRAARPKPLELQAEMSAAQRQELATEKYLLDGFFKAKLQNADSELDLTDVQMIRNLQAVARHMVDRSDIRNQEKGR